MNNGRHYHICVDCKKMLISFRGRAKHRQNGHKVINSGISEGRLAKFNLDIRDVVNLKDKIL